MNDQNYIEFKKKRDLGKIISDTLNFIREEGQPLLSVIIKVSVIPMIMVAVAGIYYAYLTSKMQSSSANYGYPVFDGYDFGGMLVASLLLLLAYLVAHALIAASTLSYIHSYESNNGKVNFKDVYDMVKNKFGSFIGLNLLNGIVIGVGLMFCFLPGIYFWIVLSLSPCLLIFQGKGALDSFGDSFSYTKENFWNIFGSVFVIWVILFVLGILINLPVTFYTGADVNIFSQDVTIDMDQMISDPIYLILTVVAYIVDFFFQVLIMISRAFIFFDIEEQNNPTTHNVIDQIGVE